MAMDNLTRRSLLISMATAAMAAPALALEQQMETMATTGSTVFVGGYTDQGSKSLGIYGYRWNAVKGELSPLGLAAATPNPSFMALAPDRRTLYAVNEVSNYEGKSDGSVSAFAVNGPAGKLTAKKVDSSGGSGPCHVSTDHKGECVFVANYVGGSAASYTTPAAGQLTGPVSNPHYSGHGPNAVRQNTAHGHCATVTPDNEHLLVNDLGLDRIHIYRADMKTGELTPSEPPAYESEPGSGPRSLAFHPNGRVAYVTCELANTVDVLTWNPGKSTLMRLQNISSLQPGTPYDKAVTVASVVVDRAGRFVYVSNRSGGHDSLTVFEVEQESGKLKFAQNISSGGKIPRHFAIDPTGKWIVVAHQGSHTLVVFARDERTGRLTPTGRTYPIDWPTCVLFVAQT